MKKVLLASILAVAMMAAGCGFNQSGSLNIPNTATPPAEPSQAPAEPSLSPAEPSQSPSEPSQAPIEPPTTVNPVVQQRLEGLVKNEYDGIEMMAEVMERKAILPGAVVPVTVTVKNIGDKTVAYVQGSGSYKTPEAIFIDVNGLQVVPPKDHVGMATMDFVTQVLEPGDELKFILHVMAIEPNDKFNDYAFEIYRDKQNYIAEVEWEQLQKDYPDLIPAKSGTYHGGAYFVYYTLNEAGNADFTANATGYAEYGFVIGVS